MMDCLCHKHFSLHGESHTVLSGAELEPDVELNITPGSVRVRGSGPLSSTPGVLLEQVPE